MLTTDSHVYFVGGYLSNFFGCCFTMSPYPGMSRLEFNCSEQAYMLMKALTFGDFATADLIMRSHSPHEQKKLGRAVRGFDQDVWNLQSRDFMFQATLAKFQQNVDLKHQLLGTGDRKLVEAAWYDQIWGVGLRESDPLILNEANWRGTNWLGENHTRLRDFLRKSDRSLQFPLDLPAGFGG